jgi:hypothetical protein
LRALAPHAESDLYFVTLINKNLEDSCWRSASLVGAQDHGKLSAASQSEWHDGGKWYGVRLAAW